MLPFFLFKNIRNLFQNTNNIRSLSNKHKIIIFSTNCIGDKSTLPTGRFKFGTFFATILIFLSSFDTTSSCICFTTFSRNSIPSGNRPALARTGPNHLGIILTLREETTMISTDFAGNVTNKYFFWRNLVLSIFCVDSLRPLRQLL
jgi:hypothetical protein